ncbi:hypothetical protein NIES2107_72580 (plasmid) [Nostoc carneum NIES-2107]|nr:hypothetical protein NIES2107_72580 [Nostoc carneum NIES-2107]
MQAKIKNWFSNFELLAEPITVDGIKYWSVENFFQAQKTTNPEEQKYIASLNPAQAKLAGKKISLRCGWEDIKIAVMLKGLVIKFHSSGTWYRELMLTHGESLVEWNSWGDLFWGAPAVAIKDGKAIPTGDTGENYLGRLLMFVRNHYKMAETLVSPINEPVSPEFLANLQKWLLSSHHFPANYKAKIYLEKYKNRVINNQTLPSQRIQIYIFGDRDTSITKLPTDAIARLNTIINLGAEIHISDARGTDRLVQEYLKQQCYERVTVWHINTAKIQNNLGFRTKSFKGSYIDMDKELCDMCHYGLAIGDNFYVKRNIKQMMGRVRIIQVEPEPTEMKTTT